MKNFINIRLEAYNYEKTKNDIKHNFRIVKSLSQQNTNKNIYYNELGKEENRKSFYKVVLNHSEAWRRELNTLVHNRTKRNLRFSRTHLISGVITFSEQQEFNQNNNCLDILTLVKNAKKTLDTICKKYKAKILYFVLHLDEKSPHFHFHLSNYDEEGYSLFKKMKTKKNLSQLQDIAYENFKNMNMKRGIKKDSTKRAYDYVTIQQFHEAERIKIREEIKQLREQYKLEKQQLREKKREITKSNFLKKEEKKVIHQHINADIKTVQKQEKHHISLLHEKLEKLKPIKAEENIQEEQKLKTKKEVSHEIRRR